MSVGKSLAAAAFLSLLGAPAMAQQVISEPGYCAQFYPNANCQNKGPGNPYTGGYQRYPGYDGMYQRYPAYDGMSAPGQTVGAAVPRPRAHHRAAPRPQ
jgi:hypothetical protein